MNKLCVKKSGLCGGLRTSREPNSNGVLKVQVYVVLEL